MDYVQLSRDTRQSVAPVADNEKVAEYRAGQLYGLKLARHMGNMEKVEDLEDSFADGAKGMLLMDPDKQHAFKRGAWEGYFSLRGGWLRIHMDECPHPPVSVE